MERSAEFDNLHPKSAGLLAARINELEPVEPSDFSELDTFVSGIIEQYQQHKNLNPVLVEDLGHLALTMVKIKSLEKEVERQVSHSRRYGASWTEVARAVGITAPSALRRFGKKSEESE